MIRVTAVFGILGLVAFAQVANAGMVCQDEDKTVRIEIAAPTPGKVLARVASEEISTYYEDTHEFKIKDLQTVVDPESGEPMADLQEDTYFFTLFAPNSGTDTVWGLQLDLVRDETTTAEVLVTDMEGVEFMFDVACKGDPLQP